MEILAHTFPALVTATMMARTPLTATAVQTPSPASTETPLLGRKRILSKAFLHAAIFALLFALTTSSIAETPPRYPGENPGADVLEIPPFVGTQSETWEEFPVMQFGDGPISILGGTAMISGSALETDTFNMFHLCYFDAYPTDGIKFLGADSRDAYLTISFSQPISAFGAYWENFPGPPAPTNCGGTETRFSFMDTAGNLVGEVSYPAGGGGDRWHGFAFATPVKTINVNGYYVCTDGMQATLPTLPLESSLSNISTRLRVETGDNVLIGGFIISGAQPKKIIVRALGPSLPLPGALADPILDLRDSSGALIRSNNDWRSDQEAEIIATGIPPGNDLESAIVATLPANNSAYTATVRGVNNGTGVGLVEVYDLDRTVDSKLANISTRGLVQTGDDVLIGGLIVTGQNPARVIVRAIGPSLPVPGALANPTLELHDGNGALIASNDNWRTDQEAEIIATGIPPANDLESAVVVNFMAGNYTAIVRGVNNTTGVALVEAYGLN